MIAITVNATRYYACKKMKVGKCDKKRENKDALEKTVVAFVVDFLSDKANMEIIANDVLAYYDKRTDDSNLISINAKIAAIQADVEKLTDAFVTAKSVLLQNSIEKKMSDYEVLLNDLHAQKVKLELERGFKLTKKDILDFIEHILKSDNTDKDFQKRIIDILVKKVIVYDDHTVVLFNIRGGSNVILDDISVKDVQNALNDTTDRVQTQSASLYQKAYKGAYCALFACLRFGHVCLCEGAFSRSALFYFIGTKQPRFFSSRGLYYVAILNSIIRLPIRIICFRPHSTQVLYSTYIRHVQKIR